MPYKKKRLIRRNTKSAKRRDTKTVKTKYEGIFGTSTEFDGKKPIPKKIICSKTCLQRFSSPSKIAHSLNQNINTNKLPQTMFKSKYYTPGLTPKEKSYIICSCQTKSTQYLKLKSLATNAIKENKIFSVYGSCNAVRKALLEREWVEKIPVDRMNLTKIQNGTFSKKQEIRNELERLLLSSFVEKQNPNFVWRTRDETRYTNVIDMKKQCNTIINKLKIDAMWTTKQGLCSSIKRNYWFYIEDVAEVISPRTYNSYEAGEIEGFTKDFKFTACTSLLKWILSMVANDKPIFLNTGKTSINVMIFAINRCKEYLYRKQNRDIDRSIPTASPGQWNSFLKKYYRIIAKEDVFRTDKSNKLRLYLTYAKYLLKETHRYRPQLSCEGCHNIWIIKPAHCSRGRGIRMASKLGVISNLLNKVNSKYVVQKYIEEPLLIYDTKFDIRQYYLVTSTYPLVIWMYKDCYLKFSSQRYNLRNYHESIHLTNNAVQKKYKNCDGRHKELPQNNMWDLDKYKTYLNKLGRDKVWDNVIYPGMRRSIIGIMLSCQDSLSVCKNRFELYGCDFILDNDYKPWLIEINSCPDLHHTTPVTAKICPAVVSDIIKVVIDHAGNPMASTGKFECIYKQPITIPRYGSAAELFIRGYTLPPDYFYRGNIEIKESYDADIEEQDIKYVLTKLKQCYDSDTIMLVPDGSGEIARREKKTGTESLKALKFEATMFIDELESELDDLITSADSSYSNSILIEDTVSLADSQRPKHYECTVQSVKSVTDFKSLLKQQSDNASLNQSFEFSKLDDGPRGKGSVLQIDPINIRSTLYNFSPSSPATTQSTSPVRKMVYKDNIEQAASKLIMFINKKEKEYMLSQYLQ